LRIIFTRHGRVLEEMATPLLTTKLNIPHPRPDFVSRLLLVKQLNVGLRDKLTLDFAVAGFDKTTLVSE
jgi:LuxR family maltose regulon positive regulatory protein